MEMEQVKFRIADGRITWYKHLGEHFVSPARAGYLGPCAMMQHFVFSLPKKKYRCVHVKNTQGQA